MFQWLFRTKKKAALQPPTSNSPHPAGGSTGKAVVTSPQSTIEIALQHHQAGRLSEAETCYRAVLATDPDNLDALHFLGVISYQRGNHEQAAQLISLALSRNESNFSAHNNLGNAFGAQGRRDEAIACYRRALVLKPDYIDAYINLAAALRAQGRLSEAAACYQEALSSVPDASILHFNLGNVLYEQGQLDEAIACYDKALEIEPDLPDAHFKLGNVFRDQGRLDDAIVSYGAALALKPDYVEAYLNLGNTFTDLDRLDEAIDSFQKSLTVNPEYAQARWALAMCQIPAVYADEAEPKRCRAAFSSELSKLDNWLDADHIAGSFEAIGVQQPFCLAYQEENNRELLERYGRLCARVMVDWFNRQAFIPSRKTESDELIRVGIVSQHFRSHSVWNAIVKGWFQQLDRERFALHAFYLGNDEDQETLFAKSCAAHFVQGRRGLTQWGKAIAGDCPDVLIYPEVGMDPITAQLASMRLAPVQVATWGHPETTGLPTIDYYLSAEDLEPVNAQANYAEQLITLPHLGCFYQPSQVVAARPDLDELGIDPESPLLLCAGVPLKYAPRYDSVLIEIARKLGRCRFIFFTHRVGSLSGKLRRRLEVAFAQNELDFDEFVTFISWQNKGGFYGLLKRADVFLDTIGFSGFNTAMQAVECGLPIVTREGRFLRGRLASGILKRMGLRELVAESEEDYIAMVVKLVQDTEYRERIRKRIEASRDILFEDVAPIRALEDFLVKATTRR